MHDRRFDDFARVLASASSRRHVVRDFVGCLGGLGFGRAWFQRGRAARGSANDLPAVRAQGGERCGITTITLWVNAFIPRDVPGVSQPVPAGDFAGMTMLPGPTAINDCFLTDQRTFSADFNAPSRMHSEITIDVENGRVVGERGGTHWCSPTHEVDCEDGDVECTATARNRGRFSVFWSSRDVTLFGVYLNADGNNPCWRGSPDIDYEGLFLIRLDASRERAVVTFAGRVDAFPAFEAYASSGGSPRPLFQLMPPVGNTPAELFADAARPVGGIAELAHNVCDATRCEVCRDGACVSRCDPDFTCCEGECRANRDASACGPCPPVCLPGQTLDATTCACIEETPTAVTPDPCSLLTRADAEDALRRLGRAEEASAVVEERDPFTCQYSFSTPSGLVSVGVFVFPGEMFDLLLPLRPDAEPVAGIGDRAFLAPWTETGAALLVLTGGVLIELQVTGAADVAQARAEVLRLAPLVIDRLGAEGDGLA
ncbi:MAG: hypothetical protein ACRDJH_13065 [Thermomicrobiales bacterium]